MSSIRQLKTYDRKMSTATGKEEPSNMAIAGLAACAFKAHVTIPVMQH